MTKRRRLITLLLLSAGLLAACAAPATPTPVPPAILVPAATLIPTATLVPTTAPAPATATPAPTSTPLAADSVAPVTGLPAGTDGLPWWNDTVFYEIFVRSFFDSNGDGVGDFNGLIAKLDYLNDGNPATTNDLGVTGLWLMPIQPSPSYHGYDVTDYFTVNPQYGTLDDFKRLLAEAHKRGIRIILDFVLNHTSSQHPWFAAAQDPQSPYRNWYLWSATNPGWAGPWLEPVWYKGGVGYYYAIFDKNMPDLNYTNPAVTKKMEEVARFWLTDVGVDGFRLDAAKHLIEEGQVQENTNSTHMWYKSFRPVYKGLNPLAMTVGEVASGSPDVAKYIQGDELDLAFDFNLAKAFASSAGSGKADSVRFALLADQVAFKPGQFATFLTNHDQDRVLSQLGDHPDKGKVAATMLLTAPGVPFIYYGEEIGMLGQKPDERIRTPMQWSGEKNGGFTAGTPWEALQSDFANGKNVAVEAADAQSLWSHYRALVGLRNNHAALRVGAAAFVDAGTPGVYALLRSSAGEVLLTMVNLSGETVSGYKLALLKGPLNPNGRYQAMPLMGQGPCADVTANAQGGFDGYKPVPALAPYSSLILQLRD